MVWVIVLAAGSGSRFGATPKQYEQLAGRSMVDRAVATASTVADGVVLVVAPDRQDRPVERATDRRVEVVVGGATRSDSVRSGLLAVPEEADIVVVHDAARPLAPVSLFAAVVDAVRAGADGAVPGLAVTDTIKRVEDDVVVETLERSNLVAVQTPQAFRTEVLRRAHDRGASATDDAALVERIGGRVVVVPGDPLALKITYAEDLARAEGLLP